MKRVEVVFYDDLDYSAGKDLVPADITVPFSYFGKPYELDLTQEHYQELDEFLRPYLDAAREAGPDEDRDTGSPAAGSRKSSRVRNRDMRRFAAQHGMKVHKTPSGTYYYPAELRDRYAEYERTRR